MLWEFIKSCNTYESMCRVNAYKFVEELKKKHNILTSARKLENDSRVTDLRISVKPLIEVLDKVRHIPHPFIIQCIWPGCDKHFYNHDKFKKHLKEIHNLG
jgi:hypothetical protein